MDCAPSGIRPITGTSVPRYHNQPTNKYGRCRRKTKASTDIPKINAAAHTNWPAGQ